MSANISSKRTQIVDDAAPRLMSALSTQVDDVPGNQPGFIRCKKRDDISDLVRFGDMNQIGLRDVVVIRRAKLNMT